MNSFKTAAYQVLKEANKSLHSKRITEIALSRGWLKTAGKTPEATMNAQLVTDINFKKEKSRFIKTAPSTFGLNPAYKEPRKAEEAEKEEKKYTISKDVSSKQKGDIAEARIAELVTLYGDTTLSCYKPISDDEGIDLIIKRKESLKTMYIQIKSRFGDDPSKAFTATVKTSTVTDMHSMALVFCFFDTEQGDLWDYVWFVPAPAFLKMSKRLKDGEMLNFVAGKKKKDTNKWDEYLIDKRDLANAILEQMDRL